MRVDFFQGSTASGRASAPPQRLTLDGLGVGSYTCVARAVDDGGLTQSASVTVTVGGARAMYYIRSEHINTPRMVTDQSARVVWRWDTADPFGEAAPDEDPDGDGNRFTFNLRFPGQYFD